MGYWNYNHTMSASLKKRKKDKADKARRKMFAIRDYYKRIGK